MGKLICGCGYLGRRVARKWLDEGEPVWAITRSNDRAREFNAEGIQPIVYDVAQSSGPVPLPNDIDTVLFALGFDGTAGQSLEKIQLAALDRVLASEPTQHSRAILISSTGVYGNVAGAWVNEETPCSPTRPGGKACLASEQRLRDLLPEGRRVILRLAGIYGPGRIPKLAALQRAEPLDVPEAGFLNLIHVDDAAEIVCEVARRFDPAPPPLLVVSDGEPVLRRDFYREAARRMNAPPPQFIDSTPAEGSRASEDKRVDNRRLREFFGRPLRYPSYREGLAQIVGDRC